MICEVPQRRERKSVVPIGFRAADSMRVRCGTSRAPTPDEERADIVDQVVTADATGESIAALATLWRSLTEGEVAIIGNFFSATRCGLLLQRVESQTASLVGRRRRILEEVLRGSSQNAIAIDLGLAPSTIAFNARLGLETLGVSGRPSRAHPLLMLAATVAWRGADNTVSMGTMEFAGMRVEVVGMDRPERSLACLVPDAELEVIACLIEGCSYAEIAARRGTAERTIANQIAAAFRRLNVSGRSELIQRLFVLDGVIPPLAAQTLLPPPPPPTRVGTAAAASGARAP